MNWRTRLHHAFAHLQHEAVPVEPLRVAALSAVDVATPPARVRNGRRAAAYRPNDGTIADAVKPEDFKDPVTLIREILNAG